MQECIFCQIAAGEKGRLVWESEEVAIFDDINPKAPVHLLVVPKAHIENIDNLSDASIAAELLMAVKAVAAQKGISGAYKIQINNGKKAGQEVDHLHLHVLGYPAP